MLISRLVHLESIRTYWLLSWFGVVLWCLTPLSTLFQLYIVAVSFIGGGNGRTRGGGGGEPTDLPQVTDELYHIMLYTSAWSRFQLTTSVVICTDCIGSCKSNYHTIMTTTDPILFQTIKEGWHYVDESRIYWSWCQIMNIFSLTYLQNLVPDSYLHTKNTTQ